MHKTKCNEEKIDNIVNRETVGYSAGSKKDAELVYEAFMSFNIIEYRLAKMTE
ncbi:hypothetical protein [Hathewaya massiliensis]|uniref:hypothetical protein n=1 Tax=Hathewaya massiliensis TaxID=1964382 RepID=UPI003C12B833